MWVPVGVLLLLALGCSEKGAHHAQTVIVRNHAPDMARTVREDLERHRVGLRKAGERVAAGFVKVEGEQQAKELRWALRRLQKPPKGVSELMVSPASFLAAVDMEGVVIARDSEPDKMRGMKLGERFASVRAALEGREAREIGTFESLRAGGKPSVTVVMAAPVRYKDEIVGAIVLGIPLWRLAQRLTRQLQIEGASEPGAVLWVYIYRGAELFHHGTPPDLDQVVPDAAARAEGLARSPGGFTGELVQFGRWYAYGVRPLPVLGDDIGMIIFRSDPK